MYTGKDLVLTLPANVNAGDVAWLSVWSKDIKVSEMFVWVETFSLSSITLYIVLAVLVVGQATAVLKLGDVFRFYIAF